MAKSASVYTRVDPEVKEQAEAVLDQLGISMSTAMGMFLQQIVLWQGIPFDVRLPQTKPVSFENLTEAEFNQKICESLESQKSGNAIPFEQFRQEMGKECPL